ncbi:LysE family translocator [Salinicola halimionae]|uniref:LysE family translocator n=1 Tax=Salinicola halimionae TaxID=1949081 RepID=UPI000DA127BD|nr:LysE family translocator [Salinicola halimionae]
MDLTFLLVFLPACFAINMAFGPNNLLATTNAARIGPVRTIIASFGRIAAFIPMIAIAGIGMGTLLTTSMWFFIVVKWAGAAYLAWLGIKLLMSKPQSVIVEGVAPQSMRSLMRQEFLVAAGNPKAILVFTAFLPQFVIPEHYALSFTLVGALFLIMEMFAIAIAIYAVLGSKIGRYLRNGKAMQWFNRASGALMVVFSIGMLAMRRPGV